MIEMRTRGQLAREGSATGMAEDKAARVAGLICFPVAASPSDKFD
jgi:hypothetical protein